MEITPAPVPSPETPAPETPPPAAQAAESGSTKPGDKATIDDMREAMKEIFDPEIPINIVDLGLIYKLEENDGKVNVEMTLTSPHCPVGDQLKARVSEVVTKCKGINGVDVKLVFEPPWSKESMTFDGKLQASMLGIM
jgi:metal-sulfur cluster biosynthetic enzyme